MRLRPAAMTGAAVWTGGAYVASFALRFAANVILARLLAPDIFGAMLIINSIRLGIELMSDMGLTQSLIYSDEADQKSFYASAWTLQCLRGVVLFAIGWGVSGWVAEIYGLPAWAIQLAATSFLFTGATSLSLALATKRLQLAQRNAFDVGCDLFSLAIQIGLSWVSPTLWSLVIGGVIGSATRCLASYVLPAPPHRLHLSAVHVQSIMHYGKWIFLSSLVFFASTNFDRLYLGQVVSLAMLGVFGIARAIAEIPTALSARLGHMIVFPVASALRAQAPQAFTRDITTLRRTAVLLAAVGLGLGVAGSGVLIRICYDERYWDAGWLLAILLFGAWPAVLANFGEAALLGFGHPRYAAIANTAKLVVLFGAVPIAFAQHGMTGAVVAVACAEAARWAPLAWGQWREGVAFWRQDITATATFLTTAIAGIAAASVLGLPIQSP